MNTGDYVRRAAWLAIVGLALSLCFAGILAFGAWFSRPQHIVCRTPDGRVVYDGYGTDVYYYVATGQMQFNDETGIKRILHGCEVVNP